VEAVPGNWAREASPSRARRPPPQTAPRGQLYNLREDPGELVNVYKNFPQVVERLTALLEKYKSEGRSRPA
jgi:hypothetical protein